MPSIEGDSIKNRTISLQKIYNYNVIKMTEKSYISIN